jgi:PAS domain S-box-containing protein
MNSVVFFGNSFLTLTLSAMSLALLLVYLPPQGLHLLRVTTVYWPAALVAIALSGLLFAAAPFLWAPLLTLANMSNVGASLLLALITASWNRKLDWRLLLAVAVGFVVTSVVFEIWRQAGAPTFALRVYFVTMLRAACTAWMVIELWRFNRVQRSIQVRMIMLFGTAYALANLGRAAAMFLTGDGITPSLYSEGPALFSTRIVIIATQLFVALSFTNYFIERLWKQEREANQRLALKLEQDRREALSKQVSLSDQLGESERALRGLRSHFAVALDAAQMGMWVRDGRTGEVWVSNGWRSIFGFDLHDTPSSSAVLELVHPEDRELVRAFGAALKDGERHSHEYRIVRRDGEVRWIASWSQLEFDDEGHLLFARAISADVTDRKEADRELQQRRLEVTHLSRVNMLGELSGGIAHEINQPLTAILSNAQAGQRFLASTPVDIQELQAIFDDIVKEDKRASEIIRRLRRLFTAGEVQRQSVDMNALIRDTVHMLQSDLISRHVACTTDLSPDLPAVNADPVQLQQVLINLLMNATEAMERQPAGTRRVVVTSRVVSEDGVQVTVMDAGPGLAAGDAERVFQAFYSTKVKGMGLGLSVCRTIVQAHGGRIWARPDSPAGAHFAFCIPVAA